MYIIDLFYTGDPFLFENYVVPVGKRVYFMYLDKGIQIQIQIHNLFIVVFYNISYYYRRNI